MVGSLVRDRRGAGAGSAAVPLCDPVTAFGDHSAAAPDRG